RGLAWAEESGESDELLGGFNGGRPVLAWIRRWVVHRLVSAANAADHFPAESRRPGCPESARRQQLGAASAGRGPRYRRGIMESDGPPVGLSAADATLGLLYLSAATR